MRNSVATKTIMRAHVRPGSLVEGLYLPNIAQVRAATSPSARVAQIPAHPEYDLVYQGGHTISALTFTNFFLGGDAAWNATDRAAIDHAISAAMVDRKLNNVMQQYFSGTTITSAFRPSTTLVGPPPATVSQSDAEKTISTLHQTGQLQGYDLSQSVFALILPRGTVLTDDGGSSGQTGRPVSSDHDKAASSLDGLGGYHGAVQSNGATIYYAIVVYAEQMADGRQNGIVAFNEPWKNVVGALYHELNEARTDADVNGTPGWISNPIADFGNQSVEVGDGPVFEAGNNLGLVFQEVPLADGSGTVPVQFMYSNAVHGPEGPIDSPAPAAATAGNGTGGTGSAPWGVILLVLAIVIVLGVAAFEYLHH